MGKLIAGCSKRSEGERVGTTNRPMKRTRIETLSRPGKFENLGRKNREGNHSDWGDTTILVGMPEKTPSGIQLSSINGRGINGDGVRRRERNIWGYHWPKILPFEKTHGWGGGGEWGVWVAL